MLVKKQLHSTGIERQEDQGLRVDVAIENKVHAICVHEWLQHLPQAAAQKRLNEWSRLEQCFL